MRQPWNVEIRQNHERRYRLTVNFPCTITVRLTEAEKRRIYGEADEAGLSVSRYIARTLTERRYPPTLLDREELLRLRCLLERAGVALEQIARQRNAPEPSGTALPLTEVRDAVMAVRELSREALRRMA